MAKQKVANPGRDAHALCDPATGNAGRGSGSARSVATILMRAHQRECCTKRVVVSNTAPLGVLCVVASSRSCL